MNSEPRPEPCVRAAKPYKSHGAPRLIARAYSLMAFHGGRSPRLTLKAGRKEGCKAGR
jgi:hypothetical protein